MDQMRQHCVVSCIGNANSVWKLQISNSFTLMLFHHCLHPYIIFVYLTICTGHDTKYGALTE